MNRFLKLAELLEEQLKIMDVVGLLLKFFALVNLCLRMKEHCGEKSSEAPPEHALSACKYPKFIKTKFQHTFFFFALTREEMGTCPLPLHFE